MRFARQRHGLYCQFSYSAKTVPDTFFGLLLVWLLLPASLLYGQRWIDFNPDNGRSDVRTSGAFQWPIGESVFTEHAIDGVTVRLQVIGNEDARLMFDWWKAGYDFGATFVSDGVTTKRAGEAIEITLRGLPAGLHTLTAWHNQLSPVDPSVTSIIRVRVIQPLSSSENASQSPSNTITEDEVTPSVRVVHDDDASTSFVRFHVVEGQEVAIRYLPDTVSERVVINGIRWDVEDPSEQARKPLPANADEHVAADPILRWQSPRGSASERVVYHVYFSENLQAITNATTGSACYKGMTEETHFAATADNGLVDYFWRVDTEREGRIIRGEIWRFKIRELAFPTAEGYGRFAIGGRGGRVIEVTNLEDAGPGSLRAAVEAEGARTVVFRTGGTIRLKSKLIIHHPYITIAGQTAPGDGICIRGYTMGCLGAHDVIMRHVRIRVGDEAHLTMDGTGFASTDHTIFDHCSISWSIDEAVSSRSARNITLQRCIVAEALNIANHKKYQPGKGHSFAGSISGDIGSFHHNLLAHCAGRNWSLAGGLNRGDQYAGRLDIRNNVVFNWENRTNDGGVKALNLVNNLYLPGPASRVFHLLKPDAGSALDRQQYFVTGNRMEGHYDEKGDNWQQGVEVSDDLINAIRLPEPFCESHVTTHAIDELYDNVLADVGANHHGWDEADRRIIKDVQARTSRVKGSRSGLSGIIDSQTDVDGWPNLDAGTPPLDTDHDGLPDEWERAHQLNPMSPSNNQRLPNQRLTALETYLAELAP